MGIDGFAHVQDVEKLSFGVLCSDIAGGQTRSSHHSLGFFDELPLEEVQLVEFTFHVRNVAEGFL